MRLNYATTFSIQNPDIPRAGSVEATHGGAAGQVKTPTGVFAQETSISLALQRFDENCSARIFRSTNKRQRNKPALNQRDDGRSPFLAADQWTDALSL